MDDDDLIIELKHIGARLATINAERDQLYARRMDLLQRGRAEDPPRTIAVLADACGQSIKAIDQVLAKERRRRTKGQR